MALVLMDNHTHRCQVNQQHQRNPFNVQVIRNAVTYATLLGKPVTVVNVRAKRSPPGLKCMSVSRFQPNQMQ
jgi:hypothetical protein